jgi:hypothetical protein
MKRKEAVEVLHNALTSYVEDCAGANTPEAEEIQKAWDRIQEPSLSQEEVVDLITAIAVLDKLAELDKIDGKLTVTLNKILKGLVNV